MQSFLIIATLVSLILLVLYFTQGRKKTTSTISGLIYTYTVKKGVAYLEVLTGNDKKTVFTGDMNLKVDLQHLVGTIVVFTVESSMFSGYKIIDFNEVFNTSRIPNNGMRTRSNSVKE